VKTPPAHEVVRHFAVRFRAAPLARQGQRIVVRRPLIRLQRAEKMDWWTLCQRCPTASGVLRAVRGLLPRAETFGPDRDALRPRDTIRCDMEHVARNGVGEGCNRDIIEHDGVRIRATRASSAPREFGSTCLEMVSERFSDHFGNRQAVSLRSSHEELLEFRIEPNGFNA
jgi:hypothetical protein